MIETAITFILVCVAACMVLALTFAAFAIACMVYGDFREHRRGSK